MAKSYAFLAVLLLAAALVGCEEGPFTFSIRFDTLGGLKAKAPVYWEKSPIGQVEKVMSTDSGDYRVDVVILPEHREKITTLSKFYILDDPLDPNREVVIVQQDPLGGELLKKGSTVQGEKRPGLFGQWLFDLRSSTKEASRQLQQSMQDLRESLAQSSRDLSDSMDRALDDIEQSLQEYGRSIEKPLTDEEIENMQQSLDAFIARFKELSEEVQMKLRQEVLPKLRKNLEDLRQRLLEEGRQEDAEKVDRQIEQIMTI